MSEKPKETILREQVDEEQLDEVAGGRKPGPKPLLHEVRLDEKVQTVIIPPGR